MQPPVPQTTGLSTAAARRSARNTLLRMSIWTYDGRMSRAPTTTDAFNAVGDQTRRAMLDELAEGELTVGELVDKVGRPQPQVSKHLRVLREVNLVSCRNVGRSRLYRIDRTGLDPLHGWLNDLVAQINSSYDRLDDYLAEVHAGHNTSFTEE